jgi:hypothetical protein
MSVFRKISETARAAAATVGEKSADFAEATKLRIARSRLEGDIKDIKTELGHVVYEAYKKGIEPNEAVLQDGFQRIAAAEREIEEIDMKLASGPRALRSQEPAAEQGSSTQTMPQQSVPDQATSQQEVPVLETSQETAGIQRPKFCPECGNALTPESKFCGNCGTRIL